MIKKEFENTKHLTYEGYFAVYYSVHVKEKRYFLGIKKMNELYLGKSGASFVSLRARTIRIVTAVIICMHTLGCQ